MEKRILIAVDGSVYSRKAMEYAAGMGSIVKNINYTLLHVHPKVSEYLVEDAKKDPNAIATLRKVTKKNQGDSIRLLDESKNTMVKAGIAEDKIETISQEQTRGTAKAILARVYLNAEVYIGTPMYNEVLPLTQEIISSGNYSLDADGQRAD